MRYRHALLSLIVVAAACGEASSSNPDAQNNAGMDASTPRDAAPPANADAQPAMDAPPAGMDAAPIGMDAAPIGMDAAPIGMDAAPIGMDAAGQVDGGFGDQT